MVFQSIVVELVNRFLGDYIEGLNKDQLSVSIWGGDVVLTNLFVKENFLNELDLPVKVSFGNLGTLKLKIPWRNLYTEPTIAEVDGLFVVVVPNTSVKYDEEKERKAKWDAKQKELAKIEEAKKREAEKDVAKDAAQDSFVEKLVANVIKNLEVTVTNIHVRFEDSVTNPKKPFSVGVTLRELSLRTTDENWQLAVIKEAAAVIFKLVKLDSLSLYWNCGSECYTSRDKQAAQKVLLETIAGQDKKVDFLYLIEPMTSNARLKLNMKPEQSGYIMPKVLVDVVFKEILVALAKSQYQILLEFIESLERMMLADKFRKYHPGAGVPKKGHYKEWWHFSYTCVLEETVRRRRGMWSWEAIKAHRELCAKYRDLYKTKLLTKKPSSQLLADLEKCERMLDVFNITMMRHEADMMAKKEGGKKDSSSGGWFGGWFSWGSKETTTASESESLTNKVQEAMTPAEKEKLYAAIGYQESGALAIYPKEYVAIKLQVRLSTIGVMLRDTELKQPHVLNLRLCEITADISQRPAADAICVTASLQSLSALGLPEPETAPPPTLLSSHGDTVGTAVADGSFVDLLFETNPLDGACDTRIRFSARPLETTFDAKTVNCLAEFFKPPDEVYAVQLQAAAMAKLESVRQQSATGMQYALEQKKYTEITVSLQPNCVIIPDQGIYRKDCRMLVLDLGELSIVTEKPQITPAETDGATAVLPIEELRE